MAYDCARIHTATRSLLSSIFVSQLSQQVEVVFHHSRKSSSITEDVCRIQQLRNDTSSKGYTTAGVFSTQVTPLLVVCSSWKKDLPASYVDQQMAAAGAWKSILGIHPLMRLLYPSFFTITRKTSLIDPLVNLSHPQTPCSTYQNLAVYHHECITRDWA